MTKLVMVSTHTLPPEYRPPTTPSAYSYVYEHSKYADYLQILICVCYYSDYVAAMMCITFQNQRMCRQPTCTHL